jgi:protein TonB
MSKVQGAARDRLLVTLFVATILHGVLILGLSFGATIATSEGAPGIEVLLVSDDLPEADRNDTATYLAQRTQLGSGNSEHTGRAPSPPGAPASQELQTVGEDEGDENAVSSTARDARTMFSRTPGQDTARPSQELPELVGEPSLAVAPEIRGPERTDLAVAPDTRSAVLAPYLDAWRHKVERIGTLNYPTGARNPGIKASPVLEVAISSDGSLQTAVVSRSSGYPELDEAALQILKLASPFDPFPRELARERRLLRFAYEWQFESGRSTAASVVTVP